MLAPDSMVGGVSYHDIFCQKCVLPKVLKIRRFQGEILLFFPRFFLTTRGFGVIVCSLFVYSRKVENTETACKLQIYNPA